MLTRLVRAALSLARAPGLAWGMVVVLTATTPAQAQSLEPAPSPAVQLTWDGPGPEALCLGREALLRSVNTYLGREAISSEPGQTELHVHVERGTNSWRALLSVDDAASQTMLGERELVSDGPLCADLDEALKLAVALLVDSELGTLPAPRPMPPSSEQPPPKADPPQEPALPREPARAPLLRGLDFAVLGASALLPATALGAELGGELTPLGWLSARAHLVGFLPQSAALGGPGRVRTQVLYAGAALCPRTTFQSGLALLGCAGIEGGRFSASSTGLVGARQVTRRLVLGSLGVRVALPFSAGIAGVAQAAILLPTRNDRLVYELNGQRLEFFQVSTAVLAGLGTSFTF